jgi:hypothetical protein
MYLLSHEVPIAAFLNKDVGVGDFGWRTPQTLALRMPPSPAVDADRIRRGNGWASTSQALSPVPSSP